MAVDHHATAQADVDPTFDVDLPSCRCTSGSSRIRRPESRRHRRRGNHRQVGVARRTAHQECSARIQPGKVSMAGSVAENRWMLPGPTMASRSAIRCSRAAAPVYDLSGTEPDKAARREPRSPFKRALTCGRVMGPSTWAKNESLRTIPR